MGVFADKFKSKMILRPKKTVSKVRSFEEIVEDTISQQEQIAAGVEIRGTKQNSKGEYPLKKSWYNDKTGTVDMKIGITRVFDEVIEVGSKDEYLELLAAVKSEWHTDPDLKRGFDACEKAIKDQQAKRAASRNK